MYAACHLLQATSSNARLSDPNPMFFVQVNDIDVLESVDSYLACTSDRIIVDKKQLYDVVLMENGEVSFSDPKGNAVCVCLFLREYLYYGIADQNIM